MIKNLSLTNIGPSPTMNLEFGDRLNLITGDNGLGKSFLLDIIWWALTRKWPGELNENLTLSSMALPAGPGEAKMAFSFSGLVRTETYTSTFQRDVQAWTGRAGRPSNPGLVLYALSDGSFAVWDPARNYWRKVKNVDVQDRVPAYVFSSKEVWNGLRGPKDYLCNGLIRDWAIWQGRGDQAFSSLKKVLQSLAPAREALEPGSLTRISLDDVRDMPTIKMGYGQEVPIVHASSGIRRIVALAYFLVWAFQEHRVAAKLAGLNETKQVIFLIDEMEAHLHPSWQRTILPSLLQVMNHLAQNVEVQMITATHSPLIMASAEPHFDPSKDQWFDLNLREGQVQLEKQPWESHGSVERWLLGNAFDLKSVYSVETEGLIREASDLLKLDPPPHDLLKQMNNKLIQALNPEDDFLITWFHHCKRRGWLK